MGNNNKSYKDKIEVYIKQKRSDKVITKVLEGAIITEQELTYLSELLFEDSNIGDKVSFEQEYGFITLDQFIRWVFSISKDKLQVSQLFNEFISNHNLNDSQVDFINKITDYFNERGYIESSMLFDPPFTDTHSKGLLGVFDFTLAREINEMVEGLSVVG